MKQYFDQGTSPTPEEAVAKILAHFQSVHVAAVDVSREEDADVFMHMCMVSTRLHRSQRFGVQCKICSRCLIFSILWQ